MIPDFTGMDCIKYQRLSDAYIADMRHLENNDRATWDYFTEVNFFCHKNDISHTAIGQHHCWEQENKILKGVRSIKQLKQHESLLHDCSYSIAKIHRIAEGWRGIEVSFKISSLAWECLHTEVKSVGNIITAYVEKNKVSLSPPEDENSFCNIVAG